MTGHSGKPALKGPGGEVMWEKIVHLGNKVFWDANRWIKNQFCKIVKREGNR